jgi:hypothetical protein
MGSHPPRCAPRAALECTPARARPSRRHRPSRGTPRRRPGRWPRSGCREPCAPKRPRRRGDAARRAAGEDRFALHESAAADHAVEIGDSPHLVEVGAGRQGRLDPGAEARQHPAAAPAAEERTACRIDRDEPREPPVLAQVLAAASQGARRAGRDEQVVDVPVQRLVDLPHRARGMCRGVGRVRILVRPERVGNLHEQPLDGVQARDEQVAGRGIGPADDPDVGAERSHGADARGMRSGVDDGDQPQPVVAARLREADAHVAGTRLDDGRSEVDEAAVEGIPQHLRCRPVLRAAAGIGSLELRPELHVGPQEVTTKGDQRGIPDRAEDAVHGCTDGRRPTRADPRKGAHAAGFGRGCEVSASATAIRFAAAVRAVLADHSCPSSVSRYVGPGPGPLFQYVQA